MNRTNILCSLRCPFRNADILTSTGNLGISSEFVMALYVVLPEAKADDVIPVFSGSYILDAILIKDECLHKDFLAGMTLPEIDRNPCVY